MTRIITNYTSRSSLIFISFGLQDRGIDISIFQNPCKLHLTIGCLVLLNDSEVKKAIEVLKQCRQELVE